jgi:hypothetical protein
VKKGNNAAADVDFENRFAALQNEAEEKMNKILDKSEFDITCSMKGIDILVPDEQNFEQSKFIML